MASSLDLEFLLDGIQKGDRAVLGRAITLVESERADDRILAQRLLEAVNLERVPSLRIGISGVPGAGKSTLIDNLGGRWTGEGHRVAVLAIDPSSRKTQGSILGDKTRMNRLAHDPRAFVRPSPSGGTLGGVAAKTREAMMVLEAAGFDRIVVETVGVGQGETAVADLVDTLVVMLVAGAGDELQGIKRGILEMADILVVNKADGDNRERAQGARAQLEMAMRLARGSGPWPRVLAISALEDEGVETLWTTIENHAVYLRENQLFLAQRRRQRIQWMWRLVEAALLRNLEENPKLLKLIENLEREVEAGEKDPTHAAQTLLHAHRDNP